jgi:hypothetical protein
MADEPEPAQGHPVRRILTILAFVVAAGAFASLLGWDIRGWFERLWDTVASISTEYIVAAVIAQTVQTTATAFAWYSILRYAYPGEVRFPQVLGGLRGVRRPEQRPAGEPGHARHVRHAGRRDRLGDFAGLIGGFAVQKIFFTIAGVFTYLYLFLTVPGSFDIEFEFIKDNPWAFVLLIAAGAMLLAIASAASGPGSSSGGRRRRKAGASLPIPARTSAASSCPSSSRGLPGS